MNLAILIIGGILFLFAVVILFGAPFLPTKRQQIEIALDLLDLKPGQTLLELGTGDGRVQLAAAKRGIKSVGIELNPLLVLIAKIRTWPKRELIKIIWGNYWQMKWPPADGIFVFLIGHYMKKLDEKIARYEHKPVSLASFGFEIPGHRAIKKQKGIYLYKY